MSSRIITISRQFGSGGRTVGKKLAEKLGVPCYDREIIEEVAAQSGLTEAYIADKGEYGQANFLNNLFTNRRYYQGKTSEDNIWEIQRQIILDLAEKEPCVIVGRCADYILRKREDTLRVFLHAEMGFRANRIVNVYGEREDAPEKRLRDKDKRRAAYYQFYTSVNWGDFRNYHVSLDTGKLGIDKCVDVLSQL